MTEEQTKAGRFTGVMIVSDFDGTAFGSVTGLPPQNVEAMEEFMAQGGIFAIATGRTFVTFGPHHKMIPTNAPTILSNGAGVYDFKTDQLISVRNLPDTAPEDLAELCKQMPELGFEAYHNRDIYVHNPNPIIDQHMEIVGGQYQELPIQSMPTPWLKVLVEQEHDILVKARDLLQKIRPNTYETIFSNPRYLEVTQKGVNKGSAVLDLAKEYHIDPAHIYCVGDNENDIPMLKVSAIPFAPSTSAEVVKDTNPHLLCSCQEGVLADVLRVLKEKYPLNG